LPSSYNENSSMLGNAILGMAMLGVNGGVKWLHLT
jgi:hypothetical protein